MSRPILESINLTRTVSIDNKPRTIVDNFSFQFQQGGSYLIIGPSGAGKSSLLRLFNRLDEPTTGTIRFHDKDQCNYSPCKLRRSIGYLFQTPYLFEGSIIDNIRYADSELSDDDITRLTDMVHLRSNLIHSGSSRLSGGELQRVAMARLLAMSPEVILLDEPTSSLDPTHTETIEELIGEIRRKHSVTVIVVSHDPAQALRIGGDALLMVEGRLIETGPVEQIVNNPQTEFGQLYRDRKLS
ncbi:MAG: ATP-binding cassette domain-containing protein [bacterium]|nr:ATP-binding cassette domain-containing protein [bacterium]